MPHGDEELQEIERFSISYDANDDEFAVHQMDALALGEAIKQVALMIKQADQVLNDGHETVDLRVTVPAEEGSFIVEFALFAMANAKAILPALGFSAAGGGALAIAHRLKSNRVVNVHTNSQDDNAIITFEEAGALQTIVCPQDEAQLATDAVIRRAYNEIITQPLANKDAPRFKVSVEGQEVVTIAGQDTQEFTPLPRQSMIVERTETQEAVIALTQVNFTSVTGWKMRYFEEERAVRMEDQAFMDAVLNNQRAFVKGDLFSVRLRVSTVERPNASIRTTYAIEEVYRHLADQDRRLT
ncbi:hypothetical protein UXP70_11240 [Enterobacter cloacae]|uniref:hypothetical protein n=1 Tax=Enterobacter cloacae TaxID=550 RepID=UPI002FD26B1C